ncbi:hypothetical protein C489_09321 [Natrinema versiforme JCM 10478]|uniref:Uncharacterized protein n=1 Tax=Natrinema versiforme JCM 10478 TaxID=1227496 RepID=L9Y0X6_9EURY|nr:hypothetical protein C489_09321 [Natrinema versiforme JCM 10478]
MVFRAASRRRAPFFVSTTIASTTIGSTTIASTTIGSTTKPVVRNDRDPIERRSRSRGRPHGLDFLLEVRDDLR